jgi:Asp/Glu/hydantoin racemase
MREILLLNPNSSQAVTDGISAAVEPFRGTGEIDIACETVAAGPPGIETQAHVDAASGHIRAHMAARARQPEALVIACFSDPGLTAVQEESRLAAYGIAQCGLLQALAAGTPIGIIAIRQASVPRHMRYARSLRLADLIAGDLALDLGVTELQDRARVYDCMRATGAELRDRYGARSLVLGCAGMAQYRGELQADLGLPVIDPCQAATGMAITGLLTGATPGNTIHRITAEAEA